MGTLSIYGVYASQAAIILHRQMAIALCALCVNAMDGTVLWLESISIICCGGNRPPISWKYVSFVKFHLFLQSNVNFSHQIIQKWVPFIHLTYVKCIKKFLKISLDR